MKKKFTSTKNTIVSRSVRILAGSIAAYFAAQSASAAIVYWDTNGTTAGSGAATGVWGKDNFWDSASDGTTSATFTPFTTTADDLFISAGTSGTTGTISVDGSQSANSITFDDNVAITLTGTSINLGSTSGAGIFVASGDNANNTISTGLVLGAASTIQNAGTGVLTINTSRITGTGNLTLQNNSTTAGGIALSGLMVNNVGSITNSGTSTGSVTISAIVGANVTGVTQNSTGSSLTLSGANLYSGDTISTAGTLIIGNNLALQNSALDTSGSGVVTLSSAATPTFGGLKGNTNLASVITTGYSSMTALTLNPGSGVSNTYGGIISNGSGATTLTLTGAYGPGTQVLTGANSYTGLTTISGGTLQIGDGTTGSLNSLSGLTFNTYGGTFKVKEAAASSQTMGALTFTAGSNTVNSEFNATSATLTFASLAARGAGATGNFTTTGGGTDGSFGGVAGTNVINFTASPGTNFIDPGFFFNGSSYAIYDTAGATSFLRALDYTNDTAAGTESITASTSAFTAAKLHEQVTGAGVITAQGTQTITTLNLANANNFTLTGGATLQLKGLLKSGNAAGGIISGGSGLQAATAAGEIVVRTDGASDTLTINTPILANGASLLTKSGAGTLTLGATNTYTGTTTIVAGTLAESSTGFIADTSPLTVNGPTAIFDLGANHSDTVGAFTLDGGAQITGSGTSRLTTGSTYSLKNGTISVPLSWTANQGAVTKSTNGTVTLTGNTNGTSDGTTNVNGGGLTVSAGSLVITGSNAQFKTLNSGAVINSGASVTVSAGGRFDTGQAAGDLNIGNGTAGASVTVTGANSTLTQGANFRIGTVANANNNTLIVSNGGLVNAFTLFIAQGNTVATQVANTMTITGAGSTVNVSNVFEIDNNNAGGFSVLDGGTFNVNGGTNYLGFYNTCKNNTFLVDGTNSVWNMTGVTNWWRGLANAGNALTVSNGGRVNFKGGGNTEQSGNFINLNSNGVFSTTTTALSSNTMVFNGGILEARSSATTISGGSIVLAGNGTVNSNTFNSTISSPFSGTGSLTKTGAGTLTISSTSNSFTGGAVVNGGTLLAAAATNLPSTGNLTINAGGAFSMQNNAAVTTYTVNSLTLAGGANLTFDLVGTNTVDKLTSTNAATTSGGNIGISINGVTTPAVSATTNLITSAGGGLLTGSTHYFVSNNTNYTATLAESATAVDITAYTGSVTALTNAYWLGGQVTNALGSMNFSSGTTSNWASAAAGTAAGGVVPSGSAVNVIFGATGAAQQAGVSADADVTLGSITFNDTAALTIGGSHIITLNSTSGTAASTSAALATVTAGSAISVTSFANSTNTINANLALGAAQTWNIASGKALAVGGSVYNGGFGLTIAGAGDANISGAIIGTNGAGGITQTTTGTVTLSGANTYSGTTTVNAGTLTMSGSGTLGSTATGLLAPLTLGGGKLDLGTTSQTVGAVSITAAAASGNTIQNGSLTGTSYAASNTSGNVIVSANLLANASGSAGLTKTGAGTLTLSGANTFIGATSVSAGTLSINSIKNVGGAANALGQPGIGNATINIGSTTTAGTLVYTGTGDTTDRVINLAGTTGGATLDQSGTGLLKFTSAFTATGASLKTVTLQGSTAGTGEISGTVVDNSGANKTSLTKAGTGTWTLSGTNTYTGNTTVNASGGTLQFAKRVSLYNATTASWDKTKITVNSGSTLAFNVGGTGEFDNTDVTTLLTGLTGTLTSNGMLAGSAIGFDTTNASGGTFTVANAIADTTGTGGGTLGLTKKGTGTLILSNTSGYTGATTISGGTLQVSGSISGSAVTVQSGGTLGTQSGTGGGTVGAVTVQSGGTLAPGASTGIITTGNVAIASGGILATEVNATGAAGTNYDQVTVAGTVNITGATLTLSGSYLTTPSVTNDLFFILLNDSSDAITGTFNGLAEGSHVYAANGQDYLISYQADLTNTTSGNFGTAQGNDIALMAVPEPGAAVSLLGGLGLLLGVRRRRK